MCGSCRPHHHSKCKLKMSTCSFKIIVHWSAEHSKRATRYQSANSQTPRTHCDYFGSADIQYESTKYLLTCRPIVIVLSSNCNVWDVALWYKPIMKNVILEPSHPIFLVSHCHYCACYGSMPTMNYNSFVQLSVVSFPWYCMIENSIPFHSCYLVSDCHYGCPASTEILWQNYFLVWNWNLILLEWMIKYIYLYV